MAFQVSVTHWFLLTPFCHRAAVVSRETGEQRGKGASWKQGQRDKGETRGMKNGKAEGGGTRGPSGGLRLTVRTCVRTTLERRSSSEQQNNGGPRSPSDSPPGPPDSNPSPSTQQDVLLKPLPGWAAGGGAGGPPL